MLALNDFCPQGEPDSVRQCQMALNITEISQQPRRLTQQLVQAMQIVDFYQAELARILQLQCGDIARFCNARSLLEPETESWARAQKFIRFYQLLYVKFSGDGVQMRHWIRREHPSFLQTPHLMLVDENRLDGLIEYLQQNVDYID